MSNPSDSLESVVIGDGVVVKGTFVVPSKAIVNGVIEGDLTAEEVLIGPTGKISGRIAGKVHYSEIEIEKGGEIEGSLNQGAEYPSTAPRIPPVFPDATKY